MKQAKEIKLELSEVTNCLHNKEFEGKSERARKAHEKRLRKKIPFLKTCIMYLESSPTEAFVKKELDRIETKINLRMSQFPLDQYQKSDMPLTEVNKLKKAHEKKYEIPHLREQVRTLRFLLK